MDLSVQARSSAFCSNGRNVFSTSVFLIFSAAIDMLRARDDLDSSGIRGCVGTDLRQIRYGFQIGSLPKLVKYVSQDREVLPNPPTVALSICVYPCAFTIHHSHTFLQVASQISMIHISYYREQIANLLLAS